MGHIYCFTNKINNKKYVGQTINDNNVRYNQHMFSAKHESDSQYNTPIHSAIRKWGIENFDYKILAYDIEDIDILNMLEQYYIDLYNCQVPNGYNIESGGKNAPKPKTDEQKVKLTWGQAKLTEEEIIELRKAYANNESPMEIYNAKYKDRLHQASFMNIWSGKRYGNIMPEVLQNGRHTKMTQEKAEIIRETYGKGGTSYDKLAKEFNVSKGTIADIVKNRTWKSKEPVSTIP